MNQSPSGRNAKGSGAGTWPAPATAHSLPSRSSRL